MTSWQKQFGIVKMQILRFVDRMELQILRLALNGKVQILRRFLGTDPFGSLGTDPFVECDAYREAFVCGAPRYLKGGDCSAWK